jgi:hypothetical protein
MPAGPVVSEEHNNYNNQIAPIRIGRETRLRARTRPSIRTQLAYGTEPPRRTLTEPPVGYRRPSVVRRRSARASVARWRIKSGCRCSANSRPAQAR